MEKLLASRINISQPTTERSRGPWFWFWQVQRRKSFKNLWRPPWQPQKQQQQQKWAQIWVVVLKTVSDRRWRSYDFVFIFIFFLLYSYIYFWSSLFWGSFPAFSDACPTCWLSVCLFVCLFGRVCRFLVCFCRVWATLSHCWKPAYDQLNSNNSIGLFRQSFNMQIFAFLT